MNHIMPAYNIIILTVDPVTSSLIGLSILQTVSPWCCMSHSCYFC